MIPTPEPYVLGIEILLQPPPIYTAVLRSCGQLWSWFRVPTQKALNFSMFFCF